MSLFIAGALDKLIFKGPFSSKEPMILWSKEQLNNSETEQKMSRQGCAAELGMNGPAFPGWE